MQFSIITPSYNQADWLRLCVASVADQEGVQLEHLIQDAGTPGLEEKAQQRAGYELRCIVEPDDGMYDAINRGLKKSTGEICAYLNCDEQYLPGALAAVERHFLSHPETDILFADAVVTDEEGRYICHRKAQVPFRDQLWFRMPILTCATFFRRRVFEKHQAWFDETKKVCGDVIWLMRAQSKGLRMGVLRRFTSIFTDAGGALGLGSKADAEFLELRAAMPGRVKRFMPLYLAYHRARSVLSGVYAQQPFDYAAYTRESPAARVTRHVSRPTQIWTSRLKIDEKALGSASRV